MLKCSVIQNCLYITNLPPDDHSLWKATKKFRRQTIAIPQIRKQDRSWTRTHKEKTNLFADYLATVFTPNNKNNNNENENIYKRFLPIIAADKRFHTNRSPHIINMLNPNKAPGYDLRVISGALLKNLPRKAIVLLTTIYNIRNRSHKNLREESQKSDCIKQQPTNNRPVQST
jgi:hypothetical protein